MDSWLTCISPNIGRKFKACLAYIFFFLKYRCKKKKKNSMLRLVQCKRFIQTFSKDDVN